MSLFIEKSKLPVDQRRKNEYVEILCEEKTQWKKASKQETLKAIKCIRLLCFMRAFNSDDDLCTWNIAKAIKLSSALAECLALFMRVRAHKRSSLFAHSIINSGAVICGCCRAKLTHLKTNKPKSFKIFVWFFEWLIPRNIFDCSL